MEVCGVLCFLLFFLTILTVVGHFIWLAAAAIFRALAGPDEEANRQLGEVRPDSGPQAYAARQIRELDGAARQIDWLAHTGRLTREAGDAALAALAKRRHEVQKMMDAALGRTHQAEAQPRRETTRTEAIVDAVAPTPEPAAPPARGIQWALPAPEATPTVVAASPAVVSPVEPALPPEPRRSFAEMMAGFMEERNILWGELVGGLLIVGCSIALVISLRETLENLPYFPFFIVGAVTAALIGAGRYTLSHWKLESTSRGLLVIGTMMVPLSFMVLAGLAGGHERGGLELATEAAALVLFTWLVRGAAKILLCPAVGDAAPCPDWLTTLATLGTSASLLAVPHLEQWSDPTAGFLGLVGYVPAALFVVTEGIAWRAVYRREALSARQAGGLFLSLGLSAYALVLAFVFLLFRSENVSQALEYLAIPLTLAGLPLLVGGTIASARLREETEEGGLPLGVAGVLATMLALGGAFMMVLALVAAWPQPVRLIVIAAGNAVVLSWVAHRFRLTPAYIPAQLCLAVAALTSYHMLAGHLDGARTERGRQLLAAWFAPASGVVLLGLAGLLATVAEWQLRRGRTSDGRCLTAGAGVAALASLLLVMLDSRESPGRAAGVFAAGAAGAWLINIRWRQTWLTTAAAAIFFGAALFGVRWFDPGMPLAQTATWALLANAVVVLVLALLVERGGGETEEQASDSIRRAFIIPLQGAAMIASIGAAFVLVAALRWDWLVGAGLVAVAVGGVWLVLAVRQRNAVFFAAFQAALAVAVVFGCVRYLQTQSWFTNDFSGLLAHVRSWQVYGVGLTGLALAWVMARFLLKNERAWVLLEPGWPAMDRWLLDGLVVLFLIVTLAGVAGGIADELTPSVPGDGATVIATTLHVHELLGWCWLALLASAVALTLWQGRVGRAVLGLTAVGFCLCALIAAGFGPEVAVASAARWSLALCFLGCSVLLWARDSFARRALALGIHWEPGERIAAPLRAFLIAAAVAPVLLLSADVAGIGFARLHPSGPFAGSFFARVGPLVNNLTPLALLCVGLAGHGVRERSAGYAFAAGQVALATLVGGYALAIITAGGVLGTQETVQLGQIATSATAAWLIGWLGVRHALRGTAPQQDRCAPLLAVQDALTWASYLLWLMPALALLAFPGIFSSPDVDLAVKKSQAGTWLGWLAVGAAIVAGTAYRLDKRRTVPSWFVAVAAMLLGGVVSCTATIYAPTWDQRTLMLVAAILALGFVLTLVRWSAAPPPWLTTSTDSLTELGLVCGAGAVAVLIAVHRAATVNDHYWSAAAVLLVASAAAAAALLQRGEIWMFAASLLAMLAQSLVVCHHFPGAPTTAWVVLFFQTNLATAGIVGLFWLHFVKRISPAIPTGGSAPPWLALQMGMTFYGNAGLLGLGFFALVLDPDAPANALALSVGRLAGWLALAAAVVDAMWLVRVLRPRWAAHVWPSAGLMVGVLAACTAAPWDTGRTWLALHVLTFSWLSTAGGLLAAAWTAELRQAGASIESPWWLHLFSRRAALGWVTAIAAVVTLLALPGGWSDPYRPYWPCAVVLAASGLTGALALWTRRGELVYVSGLLVNVAGHLAWLAWTETAAGLTASFIPERLVLTHVLCLALASLAWSVIELGGRRSLVLPALADMLPPFRHLAAWVALCLLAASVSYALLADATATALPPPDLAVWFVLPVLLAATAATLWDTPQQRWAAPWPQLYALGLLTLCSALHLAGLTPEWLGWAAALALGAYLLLTTLACDLGLRRPELAADLGIPARPKSWPVAWFLPVQILVGATAAVLGVWVSLTFADIGSRLGGVAAVVLLVPAGVVLARHWERLTARWWNDLLPLDCDRARQAVLLLGVLACACLHVALVGPDSVAPWLHRTVLLMAAVTLMSAVYGILLPRLLPATDTWVSPARRLATPLGIAACAILALALVQEFVRYDPVARRTPLMPAGVVIVSAALGVLIGGALTFALSPRRDLFRLSERRRTLYVYAAEVLLVVAWFHLRLNVPFIIPEYIARYWVFGIMAVAFFGVGLSELCQRRGLRVLADPLQRTAMFLPLLPLAAFLTRPILNPGVAEQTVAGLAPVTRLLSRLPQDHRIHASLWMLMGLLYLTVALSRRSSNLALAAAVLANFGLWVLFGHHDPLTFLVHPQLWLIPVGLIVLAAEQLNRQRLLPAQALALRYAGLLLVYVSSTADLFITGLGQSVELPIVLALLSVSGVLLGILLRVRAFLLLGVVFLFLDVFAQIWHAAVDRAQSWVWWASGIVLGVAILALFALFEKRRNDVLKMIDDLRHWR